MASAIGDVTFGTSPAGSKRTICLAAATASQAKPALVTDGVIAYENTTELWHKDPKAAFFLGEPPAVGKCSVQVVSRSGSGTMTATVTIWGYLGDADIGVWVKVKTLNGGSAIAETDTDSIRYSEVVEGLGAFDRIAAEVATAGTTPTVEVYLTTCSGE